MVSRPETKKARIKRHKRIRSKISGTAQCPRFMRIPLHKQHLCSAY